MGFHCQLLCQDNAWESSFPSRASCEERNGLFLCLAVISKAGFASQFCLHPSPGNSCCDHKSATQREQSHRQLNPHRSPTISKLHRMSSARERDIGSAIRSFALPSALPRKVRHNHGDFCNLGTPTMAVGIRLSSLARHVMAEGSVFPKECTSLYQGTAIPEQHARIVFGLAS